jgi:hypothetical protein
MTQNQIPFTGLLGRMPIPHSLALGRVLQRLRAEPVGFSPSNSLARIRQSSSTGKRAIYIARDDARCRFAASGKVQAFETPRKHGQWGVTDRFTSQMVVGYCQALEIDIANSDVYKSPATLVVSNDPLPASLKPKTLERAEAELFVPLKEM